MVQIKDVEIIASLMIHKLSAGRAVWPGTWGEAGEGEANIISLTRPSSNDQFWDITLPYCDCFC